MTCRLPRPSLTAAGGLQVLGRMPAKWRSRRNDLMISPLPIAALDQLVQETFALWDVTRVGFSWRHYYLNHTNRVKDLSISMAHGSGADPDLLEAAGILHDI